MWDYIANIISDGEFLTGQGLVLTSDESADLPFFTGFAGRRYNSVSTTVPCYKVIELT